MVHSPRLAASLILVIAAMRGMALAGPDSCPGTWRVYVPGGGGGLADMISLDDGTLVVATKTDGLRFYERGADGVYVWRTLKAPTRGTNGIGSNKTTSLAMFLGELWVGTQDSGISIYNFKTDTWREVNMATSSQIPTNTILRLTPVGPDPTIRGPGPTDEMMWVSTPSGAVRYSYLQLGQLKAWVWTLFDSTDGLPYNYIHDIAVQFRNGERYTWFGTGDLMVRWDGSTFVDYLGNSDMHTAQRILVDNKNNVWFAGMKVIPALQGPGDGGGGGGILAPTGLCRLSYGLLGIATWTRFEQQYGYDMSLDDSGRLWTCGIDQVGAPSGGGWVHDQGTWCVFTSPDDPISGNQITAVHALGELTWYAQSLTNFIDSYTPNWSVLYKSRLSVAGDVGPIAFTPLGTLLGSNATMSYTYPGSFVPWPKITLSQIPTARVNSFLVEWPTVWVGLEGDGLRRLQFNPVTGAVVSVDSITAADGLADDRVRSILRDKGGRLWVGTGGGLSLQGNGYWLNFTAETSPIASNDITSLCLADAARLWIGTSDGGISVLNPDSLGSGAWATLDASNGLPSNSIRGLALAQNAVIWAATASGAAAYDLHTSHWTVYHASSSALPGNSCLDVVVDSANRTWIGTEYGLAMKEGSAWRHFHPSGSTLGNDVVTNLATKGDEVWAVTDDSIAIRKNVIGPIGNFPPEVTSFVPAIAAPGDSVTVTGKYFDPRGPQYNTVIVGTQEITGGVAAKPAEIVSVTSTKIVFTVPERADSGRIRVTSNCLEDSSATDLIVGPKITNVDPNCASLGDEIKIHGLGFFTSGGVVVRFGNGPWRSPAGTPGDSLSPNLISIKLREGDLAGKVQVRNNDGATATSSDTVSIGTLESKGYMVLQGVEGLRLIWGKRTLVALQLKAVGCSTKVTGGKIYWKKKDGSFQLAGKAYAAIWDQALRVELTEPTKIDEDFSSLEFVGEFASPRSGYADFFPVSQLDGIRLVVQNNNVDTLTVDIPKSQLPFKEIKKKLTLFSIGVLNKNGGTNWDKFWADAGASLHETARQMPLPDFGPFYGDQSWMGISSSYFKVTSADLRSNVLGADVFNDYTHITGMAGDLIEPGFGQFAMALIDPSLYVDHADDVDPSGKAPLGPFFDGATAVSYNFEGKAAAIITQELCHMLGLVDDDAENHDDQNDGHSLYDEGEDYEEDSNCALSSYITYSNAVEDQLGIEYPIMRWITDGAPYKLAWGSCSTDRAKSSMSYTPGATNWNSFLEPIDYEAVIDFLDELHEEAGDGGGGGVAGERVLSLRGIISMAGDLQVTLCYLDESGAPATHLDPESEFRAVVRDAGGAELASLPFRVDFHAHVDVNASTAFQVRVPFPANARKVELQQHDGVIWSKTQSPNPPSVSFTAPGGSTFSGDQEVTVSWNASDPDGGDLQFALDFSADGGATWTKLLQYLKGTSYSWRPGYLPPTSNGKLKLRASDGFNTAEAFSAPFRLTAAKPVVAIRSPAAEAQIPEWSLVDLSAESFTSHGFNAGRFAWTIDGQALPGTARGAEYRFDKIGARIVKVVLTDPSGLQGTAQLTVHVYPDFDHDGLPNDWELANGLNPLDPTDALADADDDGLTSLNEHRRGTNPRAPDTDGDSAQDGAEVRAGTDPLRADSAPATEPILHVGPITLGFTVGEGEAASEAKSFFVRNVGAGSMTWSVQNDLPWLEVTPGGGTAPTAISLVAMPNGLGVGQYTGQIVFTAPGAQGSPYILPVKLTVKPAEPHHESHFSRGDSNADGKMNISDPSATLTYLFIDASKAPPCIDAADANDDGKVNITDAIYSLTFLFLGGPAPPPPFPGCEHDETPDALECASYPGCP